VRPKCAPAQFGPSAANPNRGEISTVRSDRRAEKRSSIIYKRAGFRKGALNPLTLPSFLHATAAAGLSSQVRPPAPPPHAASSSGCSGPWPARHARGSAGRHGLARAVGAWWPPPPDALGPVARLALLGRARAPQLHARAAPAALRLGSGARAGAWGTRLPHAPAAPPAARAGAWGRRRLKRLMRGPRLPPRRGCQQTQQDARVLLRAWRHPVPCAAWLLMRLVASSAVSGVVLPPLMHHRGPSRWRRVRSSRARLRRGGPAVVFSGHTHGHTQVSAPSILGLGLIMRFGVFLNAI